MGNELFYTYCPEVVLQKENQESCFIEVILSIILFVIWVIFPFILIIPCKGVKPLEKIKKFLKSFLILFNFNTVLPTTIQLSSINSDKKETKIIESDAYPTEESDLASWNVRPIIKVIGGYITLFFFIIVIIFVWLIFFTNFSDLRTTREKAYNPEAVDDIRFEAAEIVVEFNVESKTLTCEDFNIKNTFFFYAVDKEHPMTQAHCHKVGELIYLRGQMETKEILKDNLTAFYYIKADAKMTESVIKEIRVLSHKSANSGDINLIKLKYTDNRLVFTDSCRRLMEGNVPNLEWNKFYSTEATIKSRCDEVYGTIIQCSGIDRMFEYKRIETTRDRPKTELGANYLGFEVNFLPYSYNIIEEKRNHLVFFCMVIAVVSFGFVLIPIFKRFIVRIVISIIKRYRTGTGIGIGESLTICFTGLLWNTFAFVIIALLTNEILLEYTFSTAKWVFSMGAFDSFALFKEEFIFLLIFNIIWCIGVLIIVAFFFYLAFPKQSSKFKKESKPFNV